MNEPSKSLTRFTRLLSLFVAAMVSFFAPALARDGTNSSGGGDKCEKRIQNLRDDLKAWLKSPDARTVQLPPGVTFERYASKMLSKIEKAHFECVGEGDPHYPVTIKGRAKTCKWEESEAEALITCDYEKFNGYTDSQQRDQLHHEYASMAGFEKPKGAVSNYDVTDKASHSFDLQTRVVELQQGVDRVLRMKTHVNTKDLTGSLAGYVKGEMKADFSADGRMSSMVGKTVLGLLAGPALATLAPTLVGPLSFGEMIASSLAGGVAGMALGAGTPGLVAKGKASGSMEGKVNGETWQNNYSSRYFTVFVIDPSQLQTLQTLKPKGFTSSACTNQYEQLLRSVVQSKRYLTPGQARELLTNITQIRELADKINQGISKMNALDKADTRSFVNETREWLQKKMTLITIGLNGLELQPQVLYRVDFEAEYREYELFNCGVFCNSKLVSRMPMPPIYVPSTTSPDQVLPAAIEKFREQIAAEQKKTNVRTHNQHHEGIASGFYQEKTGARDQNIQRLKMKGPELYSDSVGAGHPIAISISAHMGQSLKLSESDALCSEQADLKPLLERASTSEDLLFDAVSEDTIEQHVSGESVKPMRLNQPLLH